MSFSSIYVLIIIAGMLVALAFDRMRTGMTLLTVVILLMAGGVITTEEALAGFSNKGMITIAMLFLISEGVRQSGGLNYMVRRILPSRRRTIPYILIRMLPTVAAISAFLNNTAVVIIFAPLIKRWAEKMNLPVTKFLIPLSYATILGGLCTLIGTSTNLVVHGMMIESGYKGFSMFELSQVGGVIAFVGIIYLIILSNTLLPGNRLSKRDIASGGGAVKKYYYDVVVDSNSKRIGCEIHRRRLDFLPNMRVRKVKRGDEYISAVGNDIILEADDIIILEGKSNSLESILHCDGITLSCLSKSEVQKLTKSEVRQVEVVIAPRFRGINSTIGEYDFFGRYGAAVMAIHRNGEQVRREVESHVIKEGDTFVLIAGKDFSELWGESSGFYTVSDICDFNMPANLQRKWMVIGLLVFMVLGATFGQHIPGYGGVKFDMFFFSAVTMVIMAWFKMFPAKKYTKYISWDILIAVGSAFAISKAMLNSGISDIFASFIVDISHRYGAHGALFAVLLLSMLCTELITNNAAAALCFPIAISVSNKLGVDPTPFFVAICIAASASFSTPIGYQTNLIVQGLGGYKFRDYVRIGLPLNIMAIIISMWLIPLIWKF